MRYELSLYGVKYTLIVTTARGFAAQTVQPELYWGDQLSRYGLVQASNFRTGVSPSTSFFPHSASCHNHPHLHAILTTATKRAKYGSLPKSSAFWQNWVAVERKVRPTI